MKLLLDTHAFLWWVNEPELQSYRRHLEALSGRESLADLEAFYRAAARWTVELAKRKGSISESTRGILRNLLDTGP